MDALQQFTHNLNQTLATAVESKVPLENIILTLDLAHADMILLRKNLIAQQLAKQMANNIVPSNRIPQGN